MEENTSQAAQAVTEEKKEEKPSLDSINSKLDAVLKDNESLKKRLSDKDSHITRIESENGLLRQEREKVLTSMQGKTEKQKDAILERSRAKLIEKGYDESAVDVLLETVSDISDQKTQKQLVPIIMESAQILVESDPEIDKDFLEKNMEEITSEFNDFKPEFSPRKIKANIKKAYSIVKGRLVDKARAEDAQGNSQKREAMVAGAAPAQTGKAPQTDDEKNFLDRIEKSGAPSGHFV